MRKAINKKIALDGRLTWHPATRAAVAFLGGGVGYGLIEVLWRGRTHPSMVLTGGICFLAVCGINRRMRARPLLARCAASAALITGVEFSVGVVVNLLLRQAVWDYSDEWLNLLGQVCPLYTFFWFLLCLPLLILLSRVQIGTAKKP